MTCCVDFHTHSHASDGQLSPTELVKRAHNNGVRYLALTDHDTTAGLKEAQIEADKSDLNLIPGIELSVNWENQCFHIVGLNIDPQHAPLAEGIESAKTLRISRAAEIGRRLENKGIKGVYEGASLLAGQGMITRTHFAKFLVDNHHCSTMQNAFDRYLKRGKPGFVPTQWVDLDEGIGWINGAGGTAILAHPLRYKMTATKMRRLLGAFKAAGGEAIEVVCGSSNANDISNSARYARDFDFKASVGSDFHSPDTHWLDVGRLLPLPKDLNPIWEYLGIELDSAACSPS